MLNSAAEFIVPGSLHPDPVLDAAADDAMSFPASEEDGAVFVPMERAEPTPESLSAEPSDFDELCMKVIKAGDMTSVIDDKVRDEVRFEVAVALVYAKENPHIIGGGRSRAHDSNSTVQALWRHTAVQCGFSEQEKPDPVGSKLTKVMKYARTILTKKWDKIEKPDPRAWRAKEFICHIQALENLIDGFNPNAYTPEVVLVLRRLAKKCHDAAERAADSREAQGLLQCEDAAGATSAVTHAMAAAEVARAHARSSDPRSRKPSSELRLGDLGSSSDPRSRKASSELRLGDLGSSSDSARSTRDLSKRQCLEAAECAGASEPCSSAGASHAGLGAVVGAPSSSLGAMVGASPIDGASLTPASPPKPMQAESPVSPGPLVPAMPLVPAVPLVTAGTGHPWRRQQAQQAAHLFVDGVWTEDAGGPSPIGGVARPRSLSLVGARCRSVSLTASALDDLSPLKTALTRSLSERPHTCMRS
jgi:hypothetical protein